jgi:hypothetical protein
MHSIEYNYYLRTFSDVWPKNTDRELTHQLRNSNDFIVPAAHRESFKKSPLNFFPTTLNSLVPVKYQTNRIIFKISLTDELFNSINDGN